ncbi:MAG: heavy metal translocating P-type ATPase [Coriobacteriia bacterium]|nr:heavy metal translocating P-type ATPase [Coriobacteriia bacterium]
MSDEGCCSCSGDVCKDFELNRQAQLDRLAQLDQHDGREQNALDSDKKNRPSKQQTKEKQALGRKLLWLIGGGLLLVAGIVLEVFASSGTPKHLPTALFVAGYILLGAPVLKKTVVNLKRGKIFDENFLMSIATIGALCLGEAAEALAVMLFYQTGEFLQSLAVQRSKRSIASLVDIRPDRAHVKQGEELVTIAPEYVSVGDVIVVKPGEKIPLDGTVVAGTGFLDTVALTGEAKPKRVAPADAVLSGCVNQDGLLTIEVTKPFSESTASKILELVETATTKKAPAERFITKFARIYTPIVVALALLIAIVPSLATDIALTEWLHRALIFLVISCPCALVISIPLGFFAGLGKASREGILIKGGNYLEALTKLDTVVFDKTGTLTHGVFKVTEIVPTKGSLEADVLKTAALAESFSSHPIALSIKQAYCERGGTALAEQAGEAISDYQEVAGQGVRATVNGKKLLVGNAKFLVNEGISFDGVPSTSLGTPSGTNVQVSSDGNYLGAIIISDELKNDSKTAVENLRKAGVHMLALLTGDEPQRATAMSKELGLDEAYGGLLPHQKVEKLEELEELKRPATTLAFVGDGINDAPVLARADIGVAMGAIGSDAALEAADVVLMDDKPSKLVHALNIARFTKRIVVQNIIFVLGVKVLFLALGAAGFITMWEAVFADVGVALLAILNAMRILKTRKIPR